MGITRRILNAVSKHGTAPSAGQLIFPRKEDVARDYPSIGLTPSRLLAILAEADGGSLSAAMQLYEEMEEKDAHLFSVAQTRRLALTGLPWEIVSEAEHRPGTDAALAEEAAVYCRDVLSRIDAFDELLQHMSLALGRNISIGEIVWDVRDGGLVPVDFVPLDFTRIVFDELDSVRILTDGAPEDGIAPPPLKFIIHTPHTVSTHAQRGGLLRVAAIAYLAKNLALKDWMVYSELFGMPMRIARYDHTATAEEKRDLLRMLEQLGSHASGVFSKAVELQFIEANRGSAGPPYERLMNFLNREMSKAWLGQTLTTETAGQKTALAVSQIHEQVRQDVLSDDIRKEGRTIRRDLLGPMVRIRFGPDAPVPLFRRKVRKPQELRQTAELLDVAINRLGIQIPREWLHGTLGLPMPSSGTAK